MQPFLSKKVLRNMEVFNLITSNVFMPTKCIFLDLRISSMKLRASCFKLKKLSKILSKRVLKSFKWVTYFELKH